MHWPVRMLALCVVLTFAQTAVPQTANPASAQTPREHAQRLFSPVGEYRRASLSWMRERKQLDVVPALIYALRYLNVDLEAVATTLETLTGAEHGADWFAWMLWQQANPHPPFDGLDAFQANLFARIDPDFRVFLHSGVAHEIRLEEIAWGGVVKDGIPALTNPAFLTAREATYLSPDELVFGVAINGDVRAYPYRIMDWHEMFNDVVGGVPVSLAYCTLCGSGILYDTRVEGRDTPFVFGSSGFLYRSNKLMYDQQTHSLWNQFTGRPVVGALTGSGIRLEVLPVVTTSWADWKARYPRTRVLSLDTGFSRDYSPGRPYGEYFASDALMFPALTADRRLQPKDQVFGLRLTGVQKAWPLDVFRGGRVINDRVGVIDIVLIGDAATRSVRAYRSAGRRFTRRAGSLRKLDADGQVWAVGETQLSGPDGQTLPRLPGHLAYWFAWSGYLQGAELYAD